VLVSEQLQLEKSQKAERSRTTMSYESIPDVEAGVTEPKPDPKEKYPDVGDDEAELLGMLDDVIDMPIPKFELPKLKAEQVGPATSIWEFVDSIKLPFIALIGCITTAVIIAGLNLKIVQAAFPYLAAIGTFLASVNPLTKRFNEQSSRAFDIIDSTEAEVGGKVDEIASGATGIIDMIQEKLFDVIEPIKPKLDKATKAEKVLKKFDPDIDIPDPKDIEEELDGVTAPITEKVDSLKGLISFRKFIPVYFRSQQFFNIYILYPMLAVFLIMQLMGVYKSQMTLAGNSETTEPFAANATRFLRGTVDTVFVSVNSTANATNATGFATGPTDQEQILSTWHSILISIQAFLTSSLQLAVAFFVSQAAVLAGFVNDIIKGVNDDANRAIESTGLTELFEDVLTSKMEKIKSKVMKLIQSVNKIEKVMAVAGVSMPKIPKNLAKAVPKNLAKAVPKNIAKAVPKDLAKAVPKDLAKSVPKVEVPKVEIPKVEIPDVSDKLGKFGRGRFGRK